jgi:hypothetical protein
MPELTESITAFLDMIFCEEEVAIRAAITRHLGRDDWTLDEVRSHLRIEGDPQKVQQWTLFYDNLPLVLFMPHQHRVKDGVIEFYRPFVSLRGT